MSDAVVLDSISGAGGQGRKTSSSVGIQARIVEIPPSFKHRPKQKGKCSSVVGEELWKSRPTATLTTIWPGGISVEQGRCHRTLPSCSVFPGLGALRETGRYTWIRHTLQAVSRLVQQLRRAKP